MYIYGGYIDYYFYAEPTLYVVFQFSLLGWVRPPPHVVCPACDAGVYLSIAIKWPGPLSCVISPSRRLKSVGLMTVCSLSVAYNDAGQSILKSVLPPAHPSSTVDQAV